MKAARALLLAVLCLVLLAPQVRAAEDGLDDAARLEIEIAWLEGNLERLREYQPRVRTAQDLLCFAIRDLYWRPDAARRAAVEKQLAALPAPAADSLLGRRYAWLLARPSAPAWPVAASGEAEPWPALSLLIQDREQREDRGYVSDPARAPIRAHVDAASAKGDIADDPRLSWLSFAADEFDRIHGEIPESGDEVDARTTAVGLRMRNQLFGLVGILALEILSLWYARRIKLDA